MKTNLFPDHILDDTLGNNNPHGDNGINDNDDENYNYNSNDNNDGNQLDDNNDDDNYNKYNNGNDDQKIMISQAMHFVAEFLVFAQTYVKR